MRYTQRNERLPHDKLNGTCEHQKLPICPEPTFLLNSWQSGSSREVFHPVQLDKNQKLISLCTCRHFRLVNQTENDKDNPSPVQYIKAHKTISLRVIKDTTGYNKVSMHV